ncbi:hypothetical protein I8748_31560 [Nostoc sp. CENA67]|uniref:Uncharacterized protein n=1 Tax=Amazonocrinis nigriterrae CENA67 TaxID=2794033 RepID=A0A8J7HVA8_9NOST|nr:hypothetical protein [Amazonocrinis nigriterrae]MBH8566638.1 hypothetical protein [Amazonocrinis nigriterrae CENA67]
MQKLSPESPLFILLMILSFLVVTLSAWLSPQPFILKTFGLNDIIQVLTLLFFISLLLERSLEVFITTWRGPNSDQLNIAIHQQNTLIAVKQKFIEEQQKQNQQTSVESTSISGLPPEGMSLEQQIIQNFTKNKEELFKRIQPQIDDLNTMIKELNEKERKRIAYKSDTQIIALWTSLLFGLLMSAIGIRSIEPFVVIDASNPTQIVIFRCLDALLTGGVIAGGSEGIHRLIQVFIDFMEATSKQIKNQ